MVHCGEGTIFVLPLPGVVSEFTKWQTMAKVVHSFFFWYSAGVFRDTPHESFRNN